MNNTKKYESPFTFVNSNVSNLVINNSLISTKISDELERKFNFDYEILRVIDDDDLRIGYISVSFEIIARHKNTNVMSLNATIEGIFSVGSNYMDEEEFKKMLEFNGVTALYGVSRGILSSISSVAFPHEVIRLPLLNIAKAIEDKHKKNSDA